MSNAAIDENSRETATAYLNTNGRTITRVCADASSHSMCVDDDTTGSDNGGNVNTLDENSRPIFFVESSDGNGTLVALYTDADGLLLVDSN